MRRGKLCKRCQGPRACSLQVLAKCETRQALYNFRSIASAADGIVLSRGNLGLDLLPEKIALVQKAVCAACNALGKPIVITRVMDSVVINPRPTRHGLPARALRPRLQLTRGIRSG